jgi:hypothetical protein
LHSLTLTFDITVFNATLFVSFYCSTTCFGHTRPSSGSIAIVAKAVVFLTCYCPLAGQGTVSREEDYITRTMNTLEEQEAQKTKTYYKKD